MNNKLEISFPHSVCLLRENGITSASWIIDITNHLILYDQVQLNIDLFQLNIFYSMVDAKDIQPLFENDRIKFCPNISKISSYKGFSGIEDINDYKEKISKYISETRFFHLNEDNKNLIISQINDNLMPSTGKELPTENWDKVLSYMSEELGRKSELEEYAFLKMTHQQSFLMPNHTFYFDILRSAIASLSDFAGQGNNHVVVDPFIQFLLRVCVSDHYLAENINDLKIIEEDFLGQLHSINNLPSLSSFVQKRGLGTKDLVKICQSDEAYNLRNWLKNEYEEDADLRDIYIKDMKNLPDKKTWTKWLRFGTTTSVSTVVSLLLIPEPVLSTVLGASVGVADLLFGDKVIKNLDKDYHPDEWTTYISNI